MSRLPIYMGCQCRRRCGLIAPMLSLKYKLIQLLGALIGSIGLLAATVLRQPVGGVLGLSFGIVFLLIGVVGARLDQG